MTNCLLRKYHLRIRFIKILHFILFITQQFPYTYTYVVCTATENYSYTCYAKQISRITSTNFLKSIGIFLILLEMRIRSGCWHLSW